MIIPCLSVFAKHERQSQYHLFLFTYPKTWKTVKLMIEKASDTINFLDVEIKINNIEFNARVWRNRETKDSY